MQLEFFRGFSDKLNFFLGGDCKGCFFLFPESPDPEGADPGTGLDPDPDPDPDPGSRGAK